MPKYRLTRKAVEAAIQEWKDYLNNNDKLPQGQKLDEPTVINDALWQVNTNMKTFKEDVLNVLKFDRKQGFIKGLSDNDDSKLQKTDNEFHEQYDPIVSEYLAKILIARDQMDDMILDQKEGDIEKFEEEYENALTNFKTLLDIDPNQFDKFMEGFNEAVNVTQEMEPFFKELDEQKLDDISEEKEIVQGYQKFERLQKEKEERERREQEIKEERRQRKEEAMEYIARDFNSDIAKDSLDYFNENANFDKDASFIDNVFNEIKNHKLYKDEINKKNPGREDLEMENEVNSKKVLFGGYLKIKENYNNKNWIKKIFSFNDRKAMKTLSEKIEKKYGTEPEELDKIANNFLKDKVKADKKNEKAGKERKELDKETQNKLAKDVGEKSLANERKSEKQVNKTAEKNKNIELH